MQSGRHILLDFLLYFVINSNLLTVNNFLNALSVFVLAGNLSSNGNGIEVIFLLDAQRNDALSDLTDFFCLSSVVTILPLYSRWLPGFLTEPFSDQMFCLIFYTLPLYYFPFNPGTSGHALWSYSPNVCLRQSCFATGRAFWTYRRPNFPIYKMRYSF